MKEHLSERKKAELRLIAQLTVDATLATEDATLATEEKLSKLKRK